MKKTLMVSIIFSLFFVTMAAADEDTGWRYITSMGCHMNDGTCYININGNTVGGTYGCPSISLRWDTSDDLTPGPKNWLLLFTAAYVAGDQVRIGINGCYVNQPTYPTIKSAIIRPAP